MGIKMITEIALIRQRQIKGLFILKKNKEWVEERESTFNKIWTIGIGSKTTKHTKKRKLQRARKRSGNKRIRKN